MKNRYGDNKGFYGISYVFGFAPMVGIGFTTKRIYIDDNEIAILSIHVLLFNLVITKYFKI